MTAGPSSRKKNNVVVVEVGPLLEKEMATHTHCLRILFDFGIPVYP